MVTPPGEIPTAPGGVCSGGSGGSSEVEVGICDPLDGGAGFSFDEQPTPIRRAALASPAVESTAALGFLRMTPNLCNGCPIAETPS